MKLYIMKQNALDTLKSNLASVYGKYYTETSNKWLEEVCGENPFVEFKEITDFSLANLELSPGEVDLNNCKIIYEKLKFLSESQASDERLWAGLTHSVFYEYMRKRWDYGYGRKPQSAKNEVGSLLTRFFFKTTGRGGFYRNTLAKCWWVGHNTYNPNNIKNPFESLDIIGSSDLSTKINDFFHNYTFSSNPYVLEAIIESLRKFRNEKRQLLVRDHIRPALCYLNAIGGSVVIDCLSQKMITEIFTDAIEAYLQGDTPSANWDEASNDDDDDTEETLSSVSADVVIGCNITVRNEVTREIKCIKYAYGEDGSWLDSLDVFKGRKVGDTVEIDEEFWKIEDITF